MDSSLATALKSGFLSFDSTRVSANDVDFPIDVIVYKTNSYKFTIKRYELDEMSEISKIWGEKLNESIESIPDDWMKKYLKINVPYTRKNRYAGLFKLRRYPLKQR